MHTKKAAVYFAAAWMAAIALMPASRLAEESPAGDALGLSGVTLVVGQLPGAERQPGLQPAE